MSTVSKQDYPLVLAMAVLARSSPTAWVELVREFERYTARVKDQFVLAGPDVMQIMQGRARECNAMFDMLKDCVSVVDNAAAKNIYSKTKP